MSLIDETYFAYEPVKIDGLQSSNGFSAKIGSDKYLSLIRTIERFEPLYMEYLLGADVANEYYEDSENVKWLPLIEKLRDDEKKISPIANFVYCEFRNENQIVTGSNGDYVPKVDNMQSVSIDYKLMTAWNDMVRQNMTVCKWIVDNLINSAEPTIELENSIDICNWKYGVGLLVNVNRFV